jgi:hypothetical protein
MSEEHGKFKHPINWALIIIGVLAALLLAALVWFGSDVFSLYREGLISPAFQRMHHRSVGRPLPIVSEIQGWMTFRYINYVFNLPTNYLGSKLDISDSNYPNITLNKYAGAHGLGQAEFLSSVKNAVEAALGGAAQ